MPEPLDYLLQAQIEAAYACQRVVVHANHVQNLHKELDDALAALETAAARADKAFSFAQGIKERRYG